MSENKTSAAKPFSFLKGMTLMEYMKSDEFKERVRKAREEYQKKHARNNR